MADSRTTASTKILPHNGWQLQKTPSPENAEQLADMLANLKVSSAHPTVVTVNITLRRGHVTLISIKNFLRLGLFTSLALRECFGAEVIATQQRAWLVTAQSRSNPKVHQLVNE